jgi:hypothetical protein
MAAPAPPARAAGAGRIAATDGQVNAFTSVLTERALKRAQWVDRTRGANA